VNKPPNASLQANFSDGARSVDVDIIHQLPFLFPVGNERCGVKDGITASHSIVERISVANVTENVLDIESTKSPEIRLLSAQHSDAASFFLQCRREV
jgi:hypothetical protein